MVSLVTGGLKCNAIAYYHPLAEPQKKQPLQTQGW